MNKLIIGLLTACVLAASAVQAEASIVTRAIPKVANLVGKGCDAAGKVIWRNKGAVVATGAAVGLATKPEAFLGSAATIITSPTFGSILFYLIVGGLIIAVGRYCLHRVGLWRILPLLVVGLLLCGGGIAEAGTIDYVPASDTATGIAKPLWDIAMIIIVVIATIFL
jgi:hypothetical protein